MAACPLSSIKPALSCRAPCLRAGTHRQERSISTAESRCARDAERFFSCRRGLRMTWWKGSKCEGGAGSGWRGVGLRVAGENDAAMAGSGWRGEGAGGGRTHGNGGDPTEDGHFRVVWEEIERDWVGSGLKESTGWDIHSYSPRLGGARGLRGERFARRMGPSLPLFFR